MRIVSLQFKEKRESGGQEIMMESRLENDIDTNFINFEQQNDQKRKAVLVSLTAIYFMNGMEVKSKQFTEKKCIL